LSFVGRVVYNKVRGLGLKIGGLNVDWSLY